MSRSSAARSANNGSGSARTSLVSSNCSSDSDLNAYKGVHRWKKMHECAEFVGAKRSKHTVVAYNDAMYIFGGDNGKTMLNDLIIFSIKDASWSRAFTTGTPPAPRYHHSAVVHKSSMFVFGGYTGDIHSNSNLTNRNDLFEFNFKSAMWVQWRFPNRDLPVARSAHGAAVYDGRLWIYAGYDGNARLNDMWALNLSGGSHQWEEIQQTGDRPPTCCNFPLAVARDCMYVFSGQSGMQITNTLFEFNFQTKFWRRISNEHVLRGTTSLPPSRRYGHAMVHHDRFLYVFGGSADTTLPNDLHCYDLDAQVWSIIVPDANSEVPPGRVFHAAAVNGDAMYIFGGTVDNSVRRGDAYRFQFSSYPRCTLRDDFGKFFAERQFCDIEFIVGREEIRIPAHIAFVAARSKYLRSKLLTSRASRTQDVDAMIAAVNSGASQEVRIQSAPPEAFEIILNYIYTDRIDLRESYKQNIIILITQIYQLAGLFDMPRLAQGCIQYLDYKINKQNVLEGLYNAEQNSLKIIKDHCMQFIIKDENFTEIAMSNEFAELDKNLLVEIIRKRLNPSKVIADQSYELTLPGTVLETDMAGLLEPTGFGKEFYDIKLIVQDQVMYAHKSILAARCSYFQGMFRSFMPHDNTVQVQIGEITPSMEATKALLRYIYYGETKVSPQDALYLCEAPSYYGLANERLRTFCQCAIKNGINYENVLETLESADVTRALDVKNFTLNLIVKDFPKVARMEKVSNLSRELLLAIIAAMANSQVELQTADN